MASQPILKRMNDAIHANGDHTVNGATSDIAITSHGSDWYWVGKQPHDFDPTTEFDHCY